ncbi:MAG: 2OG-Fe(II) oxygenase [Actinomycetia bacterium]|nr:2OG-Fe(II) oxygenase [Actinomycetes bacterium]
MSAPIATIDVSAPGAGAELVRELGARSCAFVVGHGVPDELRQRIRAVSDAFFDLPEAEKAHVQWPGDGPWYGWQPVYLGLPELTGTRVPDPIERFEARLSDPGPGAPDTPAAWADTFDLWPDRPSDFVATWVEYYLALRAVATRLFTVIADELDLPAEDLPAWTDDQFANLVANHYLAQPEPPAEGAIRSGAHTDQGGLTLLSADHAPGGLEVRFPDTDDWVPVLIPPEGFLLQVGDLLEHWTNHRIRGNHHRVANPPRDSGAVARRLAIVYFHYPRLDSVIHVAPSGLAPGETAAPPLIAGEHLLKRERTYRDRRDSLPESVQ